MTGAEEQGFAIEVFIDAPTDAVWRALRDPLDIRRWHGWHTDGLDEEIAFIYGQQNTTSEEQKWLELGNGDRFTLTGRDGGTLLRLVRSPKGANPDWDDYYEDINEGWTTFLQQLRFAMERHRGEERETVFLTSDGLGAAGGELAASLADLPAGERYEMAAPTGERLSGEVWFRSANQVGVTVESWGDGLMIVGRHPASTPHPQGNTMVHLTAYGLDADALRRLQSGWGDWWTSQT